MVNARWPLLEADNLCVTFPVSGGLWRPKRVVHAVNRVTMQILSWRDAGPWSANPAAVRARLAERCYSLNGCRWRGAVRRTAHYPWLNQRYCPSAPAKRDDFPGSLCLVESQADRRRKHLRGAARASESPARAGSAAGCGTAHPGRPASAAGQRETVSAKRRPVPARRYCQSAGHGAGG